MSLCPLVLRFARVGAPARARREPRSLTSTSGTFPAVSAWGHARELDDIAGAVAIAGIGETAYTKASGRTARAIGAEAAARAIEDAGLEPSDIDGRTCSASRTSWSA